VDFDQAADELYAVAPEDFVSVRDRLVALARAAGDRPLAKEVGALRKPTMSAYLANRLAREHRTEMAALAELGALLQQATTGLDGTALRDLSRQQSLLIAALVAKVRSIAESEGRRFSEDTRRDIEGTVRAAIGDVGAAQALSLGRLAEPLLPGTSFPVTPVRAATAGPAGRERASTRASRPEHTGVTPGAHDAAESERVRAAAELSELEDRERAARAASTAASESAVLAAEVAERAADDVDRLRDSLEAAVAARDVAEEARRAASAAAEEAERAFATAGQLTDEARSRLADLSGA
jgi:hypothetical protein